MAFVAIGGKGDVVVAERFGRAVGERRMGPLLIVIVAPIGEQELTARDKTSLDIFWLKDKSLTDLDNLPEPDELAEEIIENLEAGLASFRQVLAGLGKAA